MPDQQSQERHDARERERRQRVLQLEVEPRGQGIVEISFAAGNGKKTGGCFLHYPQAGTLVGSPPRDVQYAAKLQEAAAEFNRVLDELCA